MKIGTVSSWRDHLLASVRLVITVGLTVFTLGMVVSCLLSIARLPRAAEYVRTFYIVASPLMLGGGVLGFIVWCATRPRLGVRNDRALIQSAVKLGTQARKKPA